MKKWIIVLLALTLVFSITGCQDQTNSSPSWFRTKDKGTERTPIQTEADSTTNNCTALDPHPVAQSIEEKFDVSYDDIMGWYCGGSAFSDILLALETEKLSDVPVPDLLLKVKTQTWEEIWLDLGITPE